MCSVADMATNLDLDPELVQLVLQLSGEKTKKAAVTKALEEFVERHDQSRILELMGTMEWDPTYDYKAER